MNEIHGATVDFLDKPGVSMLDFCFFEGIMSAKFGWYLDNEVVTGYCTRC